LPATFPEFPVFSGGGNFIPEFILLIMSRVIGKYGEISGGAHFFGLLLK